MAITLTRKARVRLSRLRAAPLPLCGNLSLPHRKHATSLAGLDSPVLSRKILNLQRCLAEGNGEVTWSRLRQGADSSTSLHYVDPYRAACRPHLGATATASSAIVGVPPPALRPSRQRTPPGLLHRTIRRVLLGRSTGSSTSGGYEGAVAVVGVAAAATAVVGGAVWRRWRRRLLSRDLFPRIVVGTSS